MTSLSDPTLIYPEDELLQELADSEGEWAEGAALFKSNGWADSQRKIMLDKTALEIRNSTTEKVTEAWLSQAAHADKEYGSYVTDQILAHAQWLALDAKRDRLWMRLELIKAKGYGRIV